MSSLQLPADVHAEIERLCAAGDALAETGLEEEALNRYNAAWELIPSPRNEWEASTWVLAAIADACFAIRKFNSAKKALDYALTCPGGPGNAFLHLRRGQVLLEQGDEDGSADELMRAYMGGGPEIFATEDGKYLAHLRARASI